MGSRIGKVLSNGWIRFGALIGVLAWYGLIIYWSTLLESDTPLRGVVPDWLAHGCVYAVLGGLLYVALWGGKDRWLLVSVFTFCFGLLDEIHQIVVPTRTFSLWDLLADIVGALIAVIAVSLILRVIGVRDVTED